MVVTNKKEKYINLYKFFALQFLNTIIVISLINLCLGALFFIYDKVVKSKTLVDSKVQTYREQYSDLKAYSIMDSTAVKAYLEEQDAMHSIGFQYKPWVLFRNSEFKGIFLNTDAQGFRRTKQPRSFAENPLKIAILGGSTTFGYGVADDYTIPSYVQSILEQMYPNKSILVRNYGQGFYYSSQEMLILFSLIKDGDIPDIAVFIDGANDTHQLHFQKDQPYFSDTLKDLWDARTGILANPTQQRYSWIPMVRLAKRLLKEVLRSEPQGRIENSKKPRQPNNSAVSTSDKASEYVVERYKNNMRIIRAVCQEYGIRCYFVWQPVPFYQYNRTLHKTFPYGTSEIPRFWADVYSKMKEYSSSDFLYLGELLQGVPEKVFVDDVHYNERYNKKIAHKICAILRLD